MEPSFLVDNYQFDNITFLKPKRYTEYFVSRVKYADEDLVVQFPKMTLSDFSEKNFELEFMNTKGYNKQIYNFIIMLL